MDDTMAELAQHITTRDHQRASAAAALLDTLSPGERDLVREGSSHGYASGWAFGNANPSIFREVPFPHDADIITDAAARMQQPIDTDQLRRDNPREYWLFREAAVMGFVLGDRSGGADQRAGRPFTPPAPEHFARFVVEHCQSTSNYFPVLGGDPDALAWKVLRGRSEPITRARLAGSVGYFLHDVTAEQVDDIVNGWLDNERVIETNDGVQISTGEPE